MRRPARWPWRRAASWAAASLAFCLSLLPAVILGDTPTAADAPVTIAFPRDDGAHDTSIEWWYFTGHLTTANNERYGFEYVVFRARPGGLEGYVSHFAITDDARQRFRYAQRIHGVNGVTAGRAALDLDLDGWTMRGEDGRFALSAMMPGYAIDLDVAATKPPALHDGDGYIDYGNGTASYYYSWTRMTVKGTLNLTAGPVAVTGLAWMDHQWGDFATYQDGGWDWFAVQLDDGMDVMLYLIRGPHGEPLRVDGTIVGPGGEIAILRKGDFVVAPTGAWTSPETGTVYPSGWSVDIPARDLTMSLAPTLPGQELDTRQTTGVIYWEGEVEVAATSKGEAVAGAGYVELTGYAPFEPLEATTPAATPAR